MRHCNKSWWALINRYSLDISLYVNGNNRRASYDVIKFDGFEVEHISKEIKKPMGNKLS